MTAESELSKLTARLTRVDGLVVEQIASTSSDETTAVLVDQWGRLHDLRADMPIGRDPVDGLALRQSSVSRKHATLTFDLDADRWYVTDLGSRNGTFIENAQLASHVPTLVTDRNVVAFGDLGFVFLADRSTLPRAAGPLTAVPTVQSQRRAQLVLHEPTSEGAGVVTFGEECVTLGSTQFALLSLLAERYLSTQDQSTEVRGFVRSVELIAELPWNTPHPEDNHVKQQVRRLRRAFERIGLPDVIESRQGFGYRLRIPAAMRK